MDALFFLGIFTSMGLTYKGYKKQSIAVLVILLPLVALWFVSNINFTLKISL